MAVAKAVYRSECVDMRAAGGGDGCDAGAGDSCPVTARARAGPPASTRAAALQLEPGKSSEIFQFHVKIRNIARGEHFTLPEH